MQVEQIEHFADFLALEAEWNDLCRHSHCDSFFLSHDWFRCCWPTVARHGRPVVVVVKDGAEVAGIAPLLLRKVTWRVFPARVLGLLENQDSPFADLVLAPEKGESVLSALLHHLRARHRSDLVSFAKLPQSSPTHSLLGELLAGGHHLRVTAARSPILAFRGDWQSFWTQQSQRFKKTVRSVINRLERLGTVTVEELGARGGPAECLAVFRQVAAQSWKANLPTSVCRNPAVAGFFDSLTATLQARSQLRFWVLRLNDVPIATEYHVRDADSIYALRSDFAEPYREASPGAYLNQHIVRTYFSEGIRFYDMGPGDNAYKRRWATEMRELDTFWIFNDTAYATALYHLEQYAVPQLRRARDLIRAHRGVAPNGADMRA